MTKTDQCAICNQLASIGKENGYISINCPRCGNFFITKEVTMDYSRELSEQSIVTKISGWIRENQNVKIDTSKFQWLIKNISLPSIDEKARNLLAWIRFRTIHPGESVPIETSGSNKTCIELLSICWAYNPLEIRYLLNYLEEMKFIKYITNNNISSSVIVTPTGFSYLENINKNQNSNLGFCAMWFDPTLNPAWEYSILPAILHAGYDPKRIDKHPYNGVVVDEIISIIRRSKFIVADLTGNRGGVYFEAGFAKGFGIEVIFTCRNDIPIEKLHFDVRHYNFIQWNPENYDDFKKNLALRIESTLGKGKNQNPSK